MCINDNWALFIRCVLALLPQAWNVASVLKLCARSHLDMHGKVLMVFMVTCCTLRVCGGGMGVRGERKLGVCVCEKCIPTPKQIHTPMWRGDSAHETDGEGQAA